MMARGKGRALGSRGNGRSGLCACSRLEVRCAIVYRTGRGAGRAWQAGSLAARQDAREEGSTWTVKEPRRAGECGGGHEDEGLDRGEEAHGTAARTSGGGHRSRRKLRASKATDVGVLKCEHVDAEGDRARAGGPFILNLGRGSGGSGRGGSGAETACAVYAGSELVQRAGHGLRGEGADVCGGGLRVWLS